METEIYKDNFLVDWAIPKLIKMLNSAWNFAVKEFSDFIGTSLILLKPLHILTTLEPIWQICVLRHVVTASLPGVRRKCSQMLLGWRSEAFSEQYVNRSTVCFYYLDLWDVRKDWQVSKSHSVTGKPQTFRQEGIKNCHRVDNVGFHIFRNGCHTSICWSL